MIGSRGSFGIDYITQTKRFVIVDKAIFWFPIESLVGGQHIAVAIVTKFYINMASKISI